VPCTEQFYWREINKETFCVGTFYITYWDEEFSSMPLSQLKNQEKCPYEFSFYIQDFESEGQRACFVYSL
jgi:hypothetical protein